MTGNDNPNGAVMRLFQVKTKPGCGAKLMQSFATTSADVVQHEPGNLGYSFGQGMGLNDDVVMFASFWEELGAVKQRFGDSWQQSFLPEGYEDLIEECSVTHIQVGPGWNVRSTLWIDVAKPDGRCASIICQINLLGLRYT